MSFESEINKSIEDGFIKQIADKILQEIEEISNKPEAACRRWVWELLQNAKDVPNIFEGVTVRIDLTNEHLVFSHNGNPFTIDNLTHLIQQVSSKYIRQESETKQTGKYGTGFIATHTLSKIIQVLGYVNNNDGVTKKFSFDLDRSPKDQQVMMEKIRISLDRLKHLSNDALYPVEFSFLDRSEDFMTTQFVYNLSDESRKYAIKGLEDLDFSLPLTLCILNKKLKSVEVRNHSENKHYIYKVTNIWHPDGIVQYEITRQDLQNPTETKIQHIVTSEDDEIIVALTLQKNANGSFYVKKRIPEASILFKEFPLIGTQDFYFPAYIQSSNFEPTKDRDGIFLKEDNQEIVTTNRVQITKALELFKRFFSMDAAASWGNPHLLAISRMPYNKQGYLNEEWYSVNVQTKLREFLLDIPLVEVHDNADGSRKPIRNCRFPHVYESNEKSLQFWDICAYAFGTVVPRKDIHSEWIGIISPEYETWNWKLKYTITDLLEWIQETATLSKLSESLKGIEAVVWLNKVILFLVENDCKSDLEKHAIIPNQNLDLKLLRDLVYDKDLPQILIDILKEISIDWRTTLIHKGIERIEGHQEFSIKELSSKINEVIIPYTSKSKSELTPENATEMIKKGILHLSACITSEESINRKEIFRYSRTFLPELAKAEYQIVPNTSDFNWEPVNRFALMLILHTVSKCRTVEKVAASINKNETETLSLLNDLHQFITIKEHESLLSAYQSIPNQNNELCYFNDLYNDIDTIPPSFKEILLGLDPTQDWRNILLNNSIILKLNKEKKLDDICNIIDNIVKERRDSNSLTDVGTKSHLLHLIKIITDTGNKYENYLKFSYLNKATLFMEMFENTSLKESLFRIMQDENLVQNLDTLAKLKLSSAELDKLAEAINKVGIDKVLDQIAVLVEREGYFRDMKILGDLAEDAFRRSFEELGLQVIVHSTEGACDFVLIKADGCEYSVEIKSCSIDKPSISMYESQAHKAVDYPNLYALCVLERNVADPSVDYFRANARFVIDIGAILHDKQLKAMEYDNYMTYTIAEPVSIQFENPTYKFIVKREVWQSESSLTFMQFVDHIKTSFIQ